MSLSERIAALNKRANPSPPPPHAPPPVNLNTSPNGSQFVKDKAAKFDGLGAAPMPRGSFGLGAPAPLNQKSNKELYGNRITSVSKDGKVTPSTSTHSIRMGSPGPLQSLRAELSHPSSPALSHKSSFESDAGSLPGGRAQAALPAEPLTEAAVDSLPSAVRVKPVGGMSAYQTVPPSVLLHAGNDASSSVAVEVDDVGATSGDMEIDIEGKTSPSFTHSTVSESALKEAPPVLSPESPSHPFLRGSAIKEDRPPSDGDTVSSFATARSVSSNVGPDDDKTPGAARYSTTSYNSSSGAPDVILLPFEAQKDGTPEPSVAPLPLSAHLLQTLQVNSPPAGYRTGMETLRSVIVETGSEGSRMDDVAEGLGEVDLSEKALNATAAANGLSTDNVTDDDVLEPRPDLRIPAPVLPLSSAHLRSLNIQSSLAPSVSGYDTPRSMAVEDGSVDGRSLLEATQDDSMIDHDYIQSDAPGGLGFEIPGEASSRNPSPVKPSGIMFPSTPARRGTNGSEVASPTKLSLSTLAVPGKSPDVVDMRTPLATTADLPDEHRTPPAGDRHDGFKLSPIQPVAAPSFNGTA